MRYQWNEQYRNQATGDQQLLFWLKSWNIEKLEQIMEAYGATNPQYALNCLIRDSVVEGYDEE